jgi:Cof subfamily protein (haloacid dehalogenase superfamily)
MRLLALDLDGTLFGHDGVIRPRVRQAIADAARRSVTVTLATGRAFDVAARYARDLGIEAPLICYQGALIQDMASGQVWHAETLPAAALPEVVRLAEARGWDLHFQRDGQVFVRGRQEDEHLYWLLFGLPVVELIDLRAALDPPPIKFVITCPLEHADAIHAELHERFAAHLNIVRSHDILVEGIAAGVTKGSALAKLAERLDVPQTAVMAIGDRDNDVPMLTWAGLGVAMGDAPSEVRAVARWVAPSLAEDGAAVAIERFITG